LVVSLSEILLLLTRISCSSDLESTSLPERTFEYPPSRSHFFLVHLLLLSVHLVYCFCFFSLLLLVLLLLRWHGIKHDLSLSFSLSFSPSPGPLLFSPRIIIH
jgi:hypothetical protein